MITKKQFCEMKIKHYLRRNNIKEISDLLVAQSSTIAICMEYLDLIKSDELKEYAKSRDNALFSYWDKEKFEACILSVREFIDLLPE